MRSASSTWGSVRIRVAIFLWVGQGRGTGRYISIALENAPPCSNRRTWLSVMIAGFLGSNSRCPTPIIHEVS
jgi:hypothetical protein